jgi:hypothetical protein
MLSTLLFIKMGGGAQKSFKNEIIASNLKKIKDNSIKILQRMQNE